jgi:hypothetical protein
MIGEALLHLTRLASTVRIPQPQNAAIDASVQDKQPPAALRMKGVDNLEL